MDIYSDHWLYLFLSQFKNEHNQKALNSLEQFAFNVDVLEEPVTMVSFADLPKYMSAYNSNDNNFHIVVDKNFFVYVLQRTIHPTQFHTYHFQTFGPAYDYINGMHFELDANNILFVSVGQMDVSPEQLFGKYDKQLLHVYQTLPKTIHQDESTFVTEMVQRSFKELYGSWATLFNPLSHNL